MTDTTKNMLPEAKRDYKSRLFEMIYSEKKELLELYNAVNHTNYDNPELLEINTLKNAIYISMYNDLSFIIDSRLALYEHQSTINPNLPLRYLLYVSDLYSVITKEDNFYGSKRIVLPTPQFIAFYNGEEKQPDSQVLKLSELYEIKGEKISLEAEVTMLNINLGHNLELLDSCKTLRDYSVYTAKVRTYAKTMPLRDAVERAVEECIRENILGEFLTKNKAEAIKVSIYEFDEEKYTRLVRQEGEEQAMELTKLLISAGRIEELKESFHDIAKRESLYKEFGIK